VGCVFRVISTALGFLRGDSRVSVVEWCTSFSMFAANGVEVYCCSRFGQ